MSRRQRLVNLAIAAVIAVIAVVALVARSGSDDGAERGTVATPAPARTETPRGAEPKRTPEPVAEIRVTAGEVVGGVRTIEATEGDRIRFDVTSDVAEEVHVHAYDIYRELAPGEPTRFAFPATITGVIEVELHGAGLPIAELRVEP